MRQPDEGDRCRHADCGGRLMFKPAENCSCHIAPPCGECVEAPLICDECGDEPNEGDD